MRAGAVLWIAHADRRAPLTDSMRARAIAASIFLNLHYTGMRTAKEALDRLCDPAARVSAHYLIDEDGAVTRLVAEDKRAWHAGISSWRGRNDINGASIGIELVNPGHEFGYRHFAKSQMAALKELAKGILSRHPIPARHVIGHSDVAPSRSKTRANSSIGHVWRVSASVSGPISPAKQRQSRPDCAKSSRSSARSGICARKAARSMRSRLPQSSLSSVISGRSTAMACWIPKPRDGSQSTHNKSPDRV